MILRLGLLVLTFSAFGQAIASQAPPDNPPTWLKAKTLLWETKIGGSRIYLLGSIHIGLKDFYPLAPEVQTAFDQAQELIFELSPAELGKGLAMVARRDPSTGSSRRMASFFKAEERSIWQAFAKWLDLGFGAFSQMSVMDAWLRYEARVEALSGLEAQYGIDLYLMDQAYRAGKILSGLETAEEQFGALFDRDIDDQVKDLREAAADLKAGVRGLQELARLYRERDATGIWREIVQETKESGTMGTLLFGRNQVMATRIIDRFKFEAPTRVLVVVGAAHLAGPQSILDLLAARGYPISSVGPQP